MSSEYCIVCAETLDFTAYGPCGHKDTCSRCVIRLRTVLKDDRCVYCQQPCNCVFVTRYAGDFTRSMSPEEFSRLDDGVKKGELFYLDVAKAYFDDSSHYKCLKGLCSYSHPAVDDGKKFNSIKGLQNRLKEQRKAQFCHICLEGRKVFLSEQLIYTRGKLEKHMRSGDEDGPMSSSNGFNGHPECQFCRKRFYGEGELFQHMHAAHEECFICKRADSRRHIYYRDYADMEEHFRREHYLCEHPGCLEQKFVVFASEESLRAHKAKEHGQEMSKAERRQAMTLPVAINYARGDNAVSRPVVADMMRNAVVIGGDANMPSRSRGNSRANLVLEEQMAALEMKSIQQQNQAAQSSALTENEFPSILGRGNAGPAIGGRWAGAVQPNSSNLLNEDFPALPGTSKSAKRRMAKKKNAADVVGRGEIRVIKPSSTTFPALPSRNDNPAIAASSSKTALEPQGAMFGAPIPGRISEELKEANRNLIEKIKKKVGTVEDFERIKLRSADWLEGRISSTKYHETLVSSGLADLVPDLASTCPDASKRKDLLNIHALAFESRPSSSVPGGWVPPEVAVLSSQNAETCNWTCHNCTLLNIHKAKACEACGSLRPGDIEGRVAQSYVRGNAKAAKLNSDEFPSLVAPSSKKLPTKQSTETKGNGKGKKKGKQSLLDFMQATSVHPQNPWRNPNLRGDWASNGKLASQQSAVNDAWRK